ncbi:MAG: hypothetical protein ACYTG7_14335 [Planctomycetota bacterium]|jgi:hypothetical protein
MKRISMFLMVAAFLAVLCSGAFAQEERKCDRCIKLDTHGTIEMKDGKTLFLKMPGKDEEECQIEAGTISLDGHNVILLSEDGKELILQGEGDDAGGTIVLGDDGHEWTLKADGLSLARALEEGEERLIRHGDNVILLRGGEHTHGIHGEAAELHVEMLPHAEALPAPPHPEHDKLLKAAKLLRAAGLAEEAEKLEKKAGKGKKGERAVDVQVIGAPHDAHQAHDTVDELRAEIHSLRKSIEKMRKRLEAMGDKKKAIGYTAPRRLEDVFECDDGEVILEEIHEVGESNVILETIHEGIGGLIEEIIEEEVEEAFDGQQVSYRYKVSSPDTGVGCGVSCGVAAEACQSGSAGICISGCGKGEARCKVSRGKGGIGYAYTVGKDGSVKCTGPGCKVICKDCKGRCGDCGDCCPECKDSGCVDCKDCCPDCCPSCCDDCGKGSCGSACDGSSCGSGCKVINLKGKAGKGRKIFYAPDLPIKEIKAPKKPVKQTHI